MFLYQAWQDSKVLTPYLNVIDMEEFFKEQGIKLSTVKIKVSYGK